jgi:hypothetical protein
MLPFMAESPGQPLKDPQKCCNRQDGQTPECLIGVFPDVEGQESSHLKLGLILN